MSRSIDLRNPDAAFLEAVAQARLLTAAMACDTVAPIIEHINRLVDETLPDATDSARDAYADQLLAFSALALDLMRAGAKMGVSIAVDGPDVEVADMTSRQQWLQHHLPVALRILDNEQPPGAVSLQRGQRQP